ncbi:MULTISPECIES: hypothetical protein [Nostoc]|uniref:Uncharacterized protein n=1 Tax=Nostoc paludosum FACHB-159 TaxID=2692908 RepID=A0ABR8K0R4_9NOSO|nr:MULTISPECIES: hypothetical protein [Nostoc]MBD2677173.1 hypothetical protein [Nostoc sp. FACHB-857]MBD2733018.1 hypothetical protein [Nostoc paludosum FACHB-159]
MMFLMSCDRISKYIYHLGAIAINFQQKICVYFLTANEVVKYTNIRYIHVSMNW